MTIKQFLNILWSRRWILLSVLAITSSLTLLVNLRMAKQYVATTALVVDQRGIDQITGLTVPVQLLAGYMATQSEVIASPNVARKVVEKLKLDESPVFLDKLAKNPNELVDTKDQVASLLLPNLDVKPSRESSLIQISFTFTDAQVAAQIANAFADAYVQTSIELRAQPAKANADWFDSQLAMLRERLAAAQLVLSNYQQQHGIVVSDDRIDIENTRLAELSRQLVESQAKTNELVSRKELLTNTGKNGGSADSLQEVLNSALIQSLKSDAARAEANFAELSKRLDKNHPQYKQAEAEVNSLHQQIQSEVKRVLNSINSGTSASKQRDALLASSLAVQKSKVLELKQQHDEISVLSHEVENAQKAYDSAMQRSVQTHMESEVNQTNISILNPALPPQNASKPKILLNLVISLFLGGLLGVMISLITELIDRRIRSAQDMTELVGIPVFAVVGLQNSNRRRLF
jgi:chain length determinant protein EpsF